MKEPTVSIIIPAFNSEKYINQCMDSLLQQSSQDFEIICIDDGSTDRTLEMLEEYRKKHSIITILKQDNLFAGVARNKGLEIARGKYVLFLDADDFFCSDMIAQIVEYAELYHTDILVFDAYQFDERKKIVLDTTWKALRKELFGCGVKSAAEIAEHIFEFTIPTPWNKLFLREFILRNCICFQSIPRTNDLYFVLSAFTYANRIALLDKKLLYYRDNNTSSLQGTADSTPMVFMEALNALKNNLLERGVYNKFYVSFRTLVLQICAHNLNKLFDKNLYITCRKKLVTEFFLDLEMSDTLFEDNDNVMEVKNAIENRENIIIYGAGEIAKTLLHFILVFLCIATEKIKIVVTVKKDNSSFIYGIPILSFDELDNSDKNSFVCIATSEKYFDEISAKLISNNFNRIIIMGLEEIFKLICYPDF